MELWINSVRDALESIRPRDQGLRKDGGEYLEIVGPTVFIEKR